MASCYRRDAARLKAQIVARAAAGETVRAICADDGAPGEHTVRLWAKADAEFGAALAAARQERASRRLAFDARRAEAFLAAARDGAPVTALFGKPGMPRRGEYYRWRRENPGFAAATAWLVARRDAQLGARGRARKRAFDPALAGEIVARLRAGFDDYLTLEALLEADPALPCWETMMRWRAEEPAFEAALQRVFWTRRTAVTEHPRTEAVCDHIRAGGTFLSYSRRPDGVAYGTLRRWMRDPAFREAVWRACADRDLPVMEDMLDFARGLSGGTQRELRQAMAPFGRRMAGRWNWPVRAIWPKPRRRSDRVVPDPTPGEMV